MKINQDITFFSWRFYILIGAISLVVLGLIARLIDLAVFERHFLQVQGDARVLRVITQPAFRGMVTDRNGYPLAVSTLVYSVWLNPKEFSLTDQSVAQLAKQLDLKPDLLRAVVLKGLHKNREFLYVKRELPPNTAKDTKALKIPGVYLQQDYKRFYPESEIAAHIVGFTNVDDKGQEGLELAYNGWLSGTSGKKLVIKDRLGRIVSNVEDMQTKKAGNDLVLSINRRMQYIAYRELMAGMQKSQSESGTAIILDIKTGEILAMVNLPSYNPNHIVAGEKDRFRNRALTDTFEPGSTIKPFSLSVPMSAGQITPNTMIDTGPGWMRVDHNVVRDEHNNGMLNVVQILQLSSNVGVTKIMLSQPVEKRAPKVMSLLHNIGFGESTDIGFPGEQLGRLENQRIWKPFALATLSFGYGLSVNALQLAHAYATLANDGIKVPLSLLRVEQPPQGERVMSAKVAQEMQQILEAVLQKGGTGSPARIPGYHVAGKTGTSWVAGPHGYDKHKYNSIFIGMAPVPHPRYVVAVVVHNPQGKLFLGGYVSGPIFAKIMEATLRMANIPPDDPDSIPKQKTA